MSTRRRRNADLSSMVGFSNAGTLNKRVELLKLSSDDNTVGGRRNETWEVFGEAWASIQFTAGDTSFTHNQQKAEITHTIAIRYRKDVDRTHMVRYNGREFEIEFVSNFGEENRFLILYVVEKV